MDLRVRIGTLIMPNPVGAASGAFGYGEEYDGLTDLSRLGAIYTKAVTPEPRAGNPVPRLADAPAGMLNSIGLANPGLEAFVRDKLPGLRGRACAVVVNVAGASEDDYLSVVERLEQEEGVGGYEINVSCPNVAHGGLAFGTDAAVLARLTRRLADAADAGAKARAAAGRTDAARRPLIIKLSPNVTDIAELARAAEGAGADALSCINTLVGMVIDVKKKSRVLAMGSGGLSGPAIRPVGVAAVHRVSRAVKIPVIGLGGITTADDALQYLLAGAKAVQIGTAIFARPEAPAEVLDGIAAFMEREGLSKVEQIAGLLR